MTNMTPKEQFRAGFLLKCAEDGRNMDDIKAMLNVVEFRKQAGGLGDLAADAATYYMSSPALLAGSGILLGAGAGGALGQAAGKASSPDIDVDDLKHQELLAAYKSHANKIRQLAALRQPDEPRRSPRLLH